MIRPVPFPKFGAGVGLHRVAAIAERLDIDLAAFGANAAVITGSNGKGSTAAMLASILQQTGESVGRFTSPHLLQINERFTLDGEDIADAELEKHWRRVEETANAWLQGRDDQLGGFEFLFLVAASWFAERKPRFTVWEAGIGGRYDPTRLVEAKRTALVSLDLEHTALLGDTLEMIAFDKLDAAPGGARVFCGESCAPLRERIQGYAKLRRLDVDFPTPLNRAPFAGAHQRNNAALAVALAHDMTLLEEQRIRCGLAATRWPGRLEVLAEKPLVVIDVGHTPAAIVAALQGFLAIAGERARVLVCGASHDKAAAAMIGVLAPTFATIICASARHKGAPAGAIAAAAHTTNPQAEIVIADDVTEARRLALAKAGEAGAVYVAGGLFLAAEFKAVDLGLDPAALVFF
ncbi:MAG TPA: cyanophycin synthetase [Caulobacterales bacterium]|nr:cyanophycin synthetase [Caulobacterales bacterium]